MIHSCCICGYRVPLSQDYPFDTRYKELSLCKDCKDYLEGFEKGSGLSEVSQKYLKMMLGSNNLMDSRVRGYLNKILCIEENEKCAEPENPERQRVERL